MKNGYCLHQEAISKAAAADDPRSTRTNFVQPCSACGRALQIRIELLGAQVVCGHCRCQFTTLEASSAQAPLQNAAPTLLERADQLLAFLERAERE